MMSLGTGEILMLLVIGLIVLGPERLPKVAKQAARLFRQFRRYAEDVRRDISREMQIDETPTPRYVPPSSTDTETTDTPYDYGYDEAEPHESEGEDETEVTRRADTDVDEQSVDAYDSQQSEEHISENDADEAAESSSDGKVTM